ncbi:hypothetical protein [Pseudomonas cucumis]|uniref:hypothetical protein n=1 Tax=Pseudomonas cucumis TaxID=2954082 RepID=UPI002733F7F9|nr:hypothetical protein [Pseudomonas cucumis]WLG88023.1 hypothetical protein PSH72_15645 [Pseudomonas cucumis]
MSVGANTELSLDWLRWWAYGWSHAHPSWCLQARIGLDAELWTTVGQIRYSWLSHKLDVMALPAQKPRPALWRLLQLAPEGRQRALDLAVAICGGGESGPTLDDAGHTWCRRMAKALQPGYWMPEGWRHYPPEVAGLLLLKAWVAEPCWEKLRLGFPRTAVEAVERITLPAMPLSRLDAMWEAVSWHVFNVME